LVCKEVYTIEIVKELGFKAKALFQRLKYNNIFTKIGDGYDGWAEESPFDAISVASAANHIPKNLFKQIKIGAHIIIPLKENEFTQNLVLLTKTNDNNDYIFKNLLPVRFVPMAGKVEFKN
jgi:protein-L-isoaspartate(D-aspartate) O-methyltransferase